MAFGNGRGVNHKRVAWVGAIGGYEFCALVVTNFHSFALKFVGECGAGAVISCHAHSLGKEVAFEGGHPYAAGPYEI